MPPLCWNIIDSRISKSLTECRHYKTSLIAPGCTGIKVIFTRPKEQAQRLYKSGHLRSLTPTCSARASFWQTVRGSDNKQTVDKLL